MRITIVGAGVIGCAIAYELAARGAYVRVLDGRGPGGGATRASAGILAPHIEGHHAALLRLCTRSLAMYPGFIESVARDGLQDVEYERSGTLQVAVNDEEAATLRAMAMALAERDVPHAVLDAAALQALEPSITHDAVAGLHIPEQGYVVARELTRALASAAIRRGAAVDVTSVVGVEGGHVARVRTADGVVESDAVVIAAGSWSPSLSASTAGETVIRPIRGQLLQLQLRHRPAGRVIWGSRCYLVPQRNGAVLVGATVEDVGFDERASVAGVTQLLDSAVALMPTLQEAAFEEVRVGLRPMTPDELPAIGPSSTMPRVFYAAGHYRNGILLAPLTARLVADLILDDRHDEDLALLRPDRLGL